MTIAAVIVGVLIVVVVGIGQLGGRVSGTLEDPVMAYPAALLDGANLGKADAPVVMQVYEDYQCPVCAKYSLDVEPVLVSQYVAAGTLRIEHNDLGILGNPRVPPAENESIIPARGAFCANEQGKYWDYAHWIYNNQDGENTGGFRRERVVAIAEAAGVEPGAFNACLDATAAATAVDAANAKVDGARDQLHADRLHRRQAVRRPQVGRRARCADRGRAGRIERAALRFARRLRERRPLTESAPGRAIRGLLGLPLIAVTLAGLAVSGYLALARILGGSAVCGPSRGCETVAASEYSMALGVPVAAWGVLFSLAVLACSVAWWRRADRRALLVAYGLLLLGTLAVAYFTYLELFVIEAICLWCVSYAVAVVVSLGVAGLALLRG